MKQLKCHEARLTRFVAATIFLLAGIQRFAVPAAEFLKVSRSCSMRSNLEAWIYGIIGAPRRALVVVKV